MSNSKRQILRLPGHGGKAKQPCNLGPFSWSGAQVLPFRSTTPKVRLPRTDAGNTAPHRDDVTASPGWIWNAIEQHRVIVHYQPQYDLHSGDTLAVEALVSRIEYSMATRQVVRHLLNLASDMNLAVVAEGIENGRQQSMLRDAGCQMGQGFLHARPMPPDRFFQFLKTRSPAFR